MLFIDVSAYDRLRGAHDKLEGRPEICAVGETFYIVINCD